MLTGFGPGLLEKRGKHRSAVKIHRTLLQRRPLAQDSCELLWSVSRPVSQKTVTVSHHASQTGAHPNIKSRQAAFHHKLSLRVITPLVRQAAGQTASHPERQVFQCFQSVKQRLCSGLQESSFPSDGRVQCFKIYVNLLWCWELDENSKPINSTAPEVHLLPDYYLLLLLLF